MFRSDDTGGIGLGGGFGKDEGVVRDARVCEFEFVGNELRLKGVFTWLTDVLILTFQNMVRYTLIDKFIYIGWLIS